MSRVHMYHACVHVYRACMRVSCIHVHTSRPPHTHNTRKDTHTCTCIYRAPVYTHGLTNAHTRTHTLPQNPLMPLPFPSPDGNFVGKLKVPMKFSSVSLKCRQNIRRISKFRQNSEESVKRIIYHRKHLVEAFP